MFRLITVARPYAKAIFDLAVEHKNINHWKQMLIFAAEVSRNEQIAKLLSSTLSSKTLSVLFIAICGDRLDKAGQNLIKIMAENRRLSLLPVVLHLYIKQCDAIWGVVEINVISARSLNEKQLMKIRVAMEMRLSRKVRLNCKIDKSIIAGIIIQTGDMVINGSVRSRLERLADVLQI